MIIVITSGNILIAKNFQYSGEYLFFYNIEVQHQDAIKMTDILKIHVFDFI